MREVIATVVYDLSYGDMIEVLDEERAAEGLPPLTDEEIGFEVRDDLAGSDLNDIGRMINVTIKRGGSAIHEV